MQNMPDSLKRIIEKSPNLEHRVRGLPNLGENLADGQFSKEVSKIYDAFGLYGNELYSLENERIRNISSRSLGGGSPMRTSAFPLCKEALINIISSDELSDYPMAAGDEESRKIILEYLKQEGFKSNNGLSEDNQKILLNYWLGKCYAREEERDARFYNRYKIDLLNSLSGSYLFDNIIADMNSAYVRRD